MQLSDYDYELPDELIARFPTEERRGSRLLDVGATLTDRQFAELPAVLRSGDLLVFNDTRVIPARLFGRKATGGRVELLIERVEEETRALVMLKASKTPKPGAEIDFGEGVMARIRGREGEFFELEFSHPVMEVLEQQGSVPLPPYLGRDAESADSDRYQTVYARDPGAVAAPTAGLHFDEGMLIETAGAGVRHAFVTLHVGAGTFLPVKVEDVTTHRMHAEWGEVTAGAAAEINATRAAGGRIIAVGTTALERGPLPTMAVNPNPLAPRLRAAYSPSA